MRRFFVLLLGIALGGGGVYFAFHYHVVRAEDGVLIVPRQKTALNDAYVDVQNWNAEQWQQHPELIHSLIAHGREDLIVKPVSHDFLNRFLRKFTDDE